MHAHIGTMKIFVVASLWCAAASTAENAKAEEEPALPTYETYLRGSAVPRETLDVFLDPDQPSWAKFDPVLGYRLGYYMPRDGVDKSRTISTAGENGARTAHMYTDRPCRINTYGDSFTQCHQVSDGETWQEYLAAHFGEPVRNFGMGGYGTYQAYRRMIEVEQSPLGAEYVVLYVWGDDHFRSVMRCRYAVIYPWWDSDGGRAFHNNFWASIEMNLDTGEFVEHENRLPTPESVYQMTEPEFMVEALRDDLMVQLSVLRSVDPMSLDLDRMDQLARWLDRPPVDRSTPDALRKSLNALQKAYGFAATRHILTKARDFCASRDKKLLIALLDPTVTRQLLRGEPRYDQPIVDFLAENEFDYFDMNEVHLRDFGAFNLSVERYMNRYFIGHYSPAGNHFFAYAIKDSLLKLLDPPPITYRGGGQIPDFSGYLPQSARE